MQDLFRLSRWRAPLMVLCVVLGLLMASASVMAAPPQGEPVMFTHGGGQPQSDCPTDMIVVAKFNRGSSSSNSYTEIVNTAGVDLDDENRYGGDWSSTTPIAYVRVTGTYGGSNTTNHDPAVTSGSFNNSGLVDGPGSGDRRYVEDVIFCAEETGTVSAFKFNDLNENGVQDEGEQPLSGWEFTLYQDDQQVGDSDTTDANGLVSFEAPVGDYVICETLQNGWTNSTPLCQPATISPTPPAPPTPITQVDLVTPNNDGFRVEFLGVSSNGLTWSYRVSERIRQFSQNRDLSHWVIGVCGSLTPNNVTASSPTYSDFNTDPTTQVFGIKWDVADNYDGQGGNGGDSAVFSFTLDTVYQITNVAVAVKSGGPGGNSNKIDVEEIAGPSCNEPTQEPEPIAFGNYQQTGSITVFKQVGTNGNFFDESTDGIFDFVYASVSEQTGFQLSDTALGGAPQSFFRDDLPTGAYSISETSQPDSNWQFFDAYCSLSNNPLDYVFHQHWIDFDLTNSNISFDLEPGQNVFCFFLNNFTPPPPNGSITIIKNVVGDDFSDTLFDFTFDGSTNFQLSENSPEPFFVDGLGEGIYNVSETVPEGWDLTTINCGVGQNNTGAVDGVNVVLEAGEDVTCTFNNTPPTTGALTITKDAQPDSDQVFEFTGSIGILELVDDGIDNGLFNSQQYEIEAGNQVVYETAVDGWDLTGVTCTGTDTYSADLETGQLSVTIPAGGNVNCTFVNVQEPPSGDLCEMNPDSILVNGCFEEPVVSGGNWNIYDNVPGWDIAWLDNEPCPVTNIDPSLELQTEATLGDVDVINGDQYAELDTDCDGPSSDSNPERTTVEISQTLTTIPGHRYEVSFYFNARPSHISQNLRVTIDGVEKFSEAAPSDWSLRTFEFVATSTETVIAFADTGDPNSYGVLIDCINVLDLGEEPRGSIRVTKFNDLNENGVRNNGEDRLPGWTFNVYAGSEAVGDPIRSNETNDNGRRTFGNLRPGTYTVCEVMQAGWTNVTPLCQTVEVVSGEQVELGFGNIELPPVTETCNASEVVSFSQGLDRNFNPIVGARSNPAQALGEPQDNDTINFVSLGFGGELILRLDGLVIDNNGSDFDLYFVETTFGNETPASYPESAEIFIALNPAGPWTPLGTVTLDGGFDFPGDGASALYVRLVDVSNRGSFSSGVADGYDLDGIRCSEPDGEIVVTKRVNWNGADEDQQQEFTLCVSGDNLEQPLCDTVDYDGGTVSFDVAPGHYNVYEYDPGDEWTIGGQTSVQVASGQTRRVTITNTHDEPEPVDGRIVITKNVVDAPQGFEGNFTICVSGGDLAQPSCKNIGANGGELSWVLPAGSYNINENYPGDNWLVEGNDHAVELEAGATETHTITNRYEEPEPVEQVGTIHVTKNVVTPPAQYGDFTICIANAIFPEDQQNQANCYTVHNDGDQIWWNVVIPEGEQSASYVISENNPGANWSVDGSGVSVTVYPDQTSYHTITNTYNTPPPPSCNGGMGQQSDLSGIITISGSTAFGTVYNNSNVEDCQYQIGMASYSKYDEIVDNQILFAGFDTIVTIPAGGSVQVSIALPECSAQVDLFYGSFLPDLNGQRYGSRLLAAVHNNIGYCQAQVVNPPQQDPPQQEIVIEEQQPPEEGGAGE